MRLYLASRSILALLFSFILLLLPYYVNATSPPSDNGLINRIISITTKDSEHGTTVNVLGNGKIADYSTKTLDFPPRIVVDILNAGKSSESMTIPVKSLNLKGIRVGYHLKRIRLVLDIKGTDTPIFTTTSANNRLTVFLRSPKLIDREKEKPNQVRRRLTDKGFPGLEKLIGTEEDDGEDDTIYFLKGVNAYKAQDWSAAIENLNHLIKTYPAARYIERAYFLLAKSYEQLYSDSISEYFTELKSYYEDAINRFPTSPYVPDALLAIGNLCLKIKNYYEALAYYNLVFKKHKDSVAAVRALMQKVKLFLLKEKRKEALSILEYVVFRYPGSSEETEAKIEMSKLLYEMSSFSTSIDILSELRITNPENIYQYPEISLYLGYNYYELGDNVKARENLLRFYNSYPEKKKNHLILTKIADSYRDEGLTGDAAKFYQLVIERHPETEGALISLIRLAELQEKGELEIERGIALSARIIGKEIGLPREIYEDIMNNILNKDKENPLAQLALFKLAILYQNEKYYDKSLKALKELLKKYPRTSLKKECKHALAKAIKGILKEEMKEERYTNIINIYQRERELFSLLSSPDPFLTVARASIHFNLQDMATDMFMRADPLLPDKEKPPDLLFFISKDLFKKNKLKGALSRLNLLIENYPTDKNTPYAYQLKGKILFKQKRYPQAVEMFSSALRFRLKRCEKTRILVDEARALMRCNRNEKALKATREVDRLKTYCYDRYNSIYQEVGDLYLHLGYPKKALSSFNDALEMEKEAENKIRLKLKIAQCYRLLDRKEDYLALYNQISGLNDPFWSSLAKERIEEINFNSEIRAIKKK